MLTGILKKIIFKKEDYIIGYLDDIKVCGNIPGATIGQKYILFGEYQSRPEYGRQYVFTGYQSDSPLSYLSSGLIKGLGESLALKIAKEFPDPIKTILNSPQSLTRINGISEKKAATISLSTKETIKYKDTAVILSPCDLSPGAIIKIHTNMKNPRAVLENPYILTMLDGIGFIKADRVAQKLGIRPDSPKRVQAAAYHELKKSSEKDGHIFLPEFELAIRTYKLLNEKINPSLIEESINKLDNVIRDGSDLYLPELHEAENSIAEFLKNHKTPPGTDIETHLDAYEVNLTPLQKEAVRQAFTSGMSVIAGGPGTGKTETVKAIARIFAKTSSQKIILAAPTGRASRRMAGNVGVEAYTIHRLIAPGKTLNAAVIVIDETSMLDVLLLSKLLKLIPPETRIVFVGDPDQLPPVAPGQVLEDLMHILPTVKLDQIFRQDEASDIIINAHRINKGNMDIKTGKEFFFLQKETPEEILETVKAYAIKYFNAKNSLDGLQVLSPMKKGILGTEKINTLLQEVSGKKPGFNIGDRVIQLQNNYAKNIFNGEIGEIISLDPFTVKLEGRNVKYESHELDQISLAYAITIHKSQGSEFPVVVIPLSIQHFVMLERKILYTAVTRAQRQAILISNYKTLTVTLRNINFKKRNTKLQKKVLDSLV